jgi:hypothetical protein
MTLKTWSEIFGHFKKFHNFKVKGGLFKEERKQSLIKNQDEWLPF